MVLVLLSGPVGAQTAPPEELARRHHERGSTFYNLGQFEEAIAEYRKGYEQKADPVFLYNIGQSYRQLGAHDKALFFYRRYLSTAPDASNRLEVEQWVAELEALVAAEERARTPAPPEPLSAPGAAPPAAVMGPAPEPELKETRRGPLWQKWWFWAGVGGVVAGGIAAALLVSSAKSDRPPGTDLGTMRFF